jgi:hypothetical protein
MYNAATRGGVPTPGGGTTQFKKGGLVKYKTGGIVSLGLNKAMKGH